MRNISKRIVIRKTHHERVPLGSEDLDRVHGQRLMVDSVDFDDRHVMTLDPEVLSSKSAHVGQAEEVCHVRAN